jgi:hypothetical protein
MPSIANITIKDGAATPVDHVFKPAAVVGSLATWREQTANGIPVGNNVLTYSVKAPASGVGAYTVQLKLVKPKVVSLTDTSGKTVNTVIRTDLWDATFKVGSDSTTQERKDLRVMSSNAAVSAIVAQAFDDLESFFG